MDAREFALSMGSGYVNQLAGRCDLYASLMDAGMLMLAGREGDGGATDAAASAWDMLRAKHNALECAAELRDGSAGVEAFELAETVSRLLADEGAIGELETI